MCHPCHTSCLTCKNKEKTTCITCSDSEQLLLESTCVDSCGDNFFKKQGKCSPCFEKCKKCENEKKDSCFECFENLFLKEYSCVDDCGT